jgi:hypothetical protein
MADDVLGFGAPFSLDCRFDWVTLCMDMVQYSNGES